MSTCNAQRPRFPWWKVIIWFAYLWAHAMHNDHVFLGGKVIIPIRRRSIQLMTISHEPCHVSLKKELHT